MKLYYFPIAPNPTRVRLALAEKREAGGAPELDEVVVSLLEGEQNSPEHRARNPLARLPVLELDDGSFLTESLPILEYLDELSPETTVVGRTPEERARQREVERLAELGVLLPIARWVHSTNSPLGLPPNEAVAAYHLELLPRNLDVLESRLDDGRPFLMGDAPTMADCTLAAALQFGRFREFPFPDGYPAIRAWDERFRDRPAAKSVLVL